MSDNILDIRSLPPREKHPTIFQWFDALQSGNHFILVNDHKPQPLYYQFMMERPEQFSWEYLEEGPEVWQVKIGKV